jgi:hypothetical protein
MDTITITFDGDSVVVTNGRHTSTSSFSKIKDEEQRALIALADFFGYDPAGVLCFDDDFEDEEDDPNMTNEEKRWNALPNFDNETVKIWLDALLESKNKMYIEELTADEIKAEIEETKGSIDNFRAWGDRHAIVDCEEYIEVLEEMLNNKEEN